ncbi:nitroreductase family deazaflavin-dependent oxidoreductase [Mycobacterium sp. WMMD1722]|uniref:nitroreductase family deazaflavin-dependent oxidoreductase n=1 Tax=Mycobacterium sp. WMMD1722 TaxID=3404117 RepID=UPI003BF59DF2
MPIPKSVARLNRVGLNKVTQHIAPWAPGFGLVIHQGRSSGRSYTTPVNVFRTPTGVRIALTYGADSQWVKNVLAAQGCTLRTQGRTLTLSEPRIVHDPERTSIRPLERRVLGMLAVDDFLDLNEYHEPAG